MGTFDSINKQLDPQREKVLDELFKDSPSQTEVTLDLPSKGKFYRNFSKATLRPVTFEDEKFIISYQGPDSTNALLGRCLAGVNINDLLLMDKIYVLLKLREISYGSDYLATVTCPSCQTKTDVKINLGSLNIKYIDESLQDPRVIRLPVLNKDASIKIPRVSDEALMRSAESIYSNLWRFVTSIDTVTDPIIINKAIQRLNMKDIRVLINQLSSKDIGVDPRFVLQCADCGANSEMAVPISDDFFSQI